MIALLILIPCMVSAEIPLTPFPYDYKPIPTLALNPGEPLRLNLSEYIPGLTPDLVTRISYPYQDQNIIVFQSPQNPLNIAIIYPETLQGYYIFPLLFEFKDSVKSPFFIAAEILSPEQVENEGKPRPRLLPCQKRTDKEKGTEEYVFYFYDPEDLEKPEIDKIKAMLGNERMIFNLGIQDKSIFVPLPKGQLSDKPLRIYAQSKKGTWAEECVVMEPEGIKDKSADWRDVVSYLVSGKKMSENPPAREKSTLEDNLTSYPLNKDEMAILEQKIGDRYFEKLFINFLFCPEQEQTPEWQKLIDTARGRNINIILGTNVPQFYPIDNPDFKTDTLWNPLLTEKIHKAFGSKTIGLTELHEAVVEFHQAAAKKGIIPAISLNLTGKPRLITLIPDTSTSPGDEKSKSGYPLKYQYHEMALGYLITFSGIPIILYGDEIGMGGEGLIQLDQALSREQKELFNRILQILEIRKEHPALSRGNTVNLLMEKERIVFIKTYFSGQILCAFNSSNEESEITIPLPPFISQVKKVTPLLKSGEYSIEKRKLRIKLAPVSFELYLLNP
jgi:hypothetical protein